MKFLSKNNVKLYINFPGENAIYNAFDWTSASESNSPKSAKHYGASHEDYGFSQYVLPFSNSWVSSRDIFSCKTLLIKAWLIQTWGSKLQSALKSSGKLRRLTPSFGTILAVRLQKKYFRNKTFFVFQDRKLKLSGSVWNWVSWNLTKFELI